MLKVPKSYTKEKNEDLFDYENELFSVSDKDEAPLNSAQNRLLFGQIPVIEEKVVQNLDNESKSFELNWDTCYKQSNDFEDIDDFFKGLWDSILNY